MGLCADNGTAARESKMFVACNCIRVNEQHSCATQCPLSPIMLHSYGDATEKIRPCPSSSQPPNNENHTSSYSQATSAAGAASFRKL